MKKKLEELYYLLDSGAITESEFQELKKKLLDENLEVDKQNESSVAESIEEDLFEDLIAKYNPNEKDLFLISFIQGKIKTSSSFFEKQKLKGKVLKLLKPYEVKFMDLGILIPQIAEKEYHLQKELQDKYDTTEIESLKQSFGLKYTVPIFIGLGMFIIILFLFPSGPSTCDCIDRMTDAALYGDSYETKYLNCLDKYYDEAFDYIEENDPNGKYANYEDVIVSYWLIKCEESKSKENKVKASIPNKSEDIIEDDEDYEDMYSEEDYEDHPEEENTDLLYRETSDEDHDGDIYTDPDAGGYAYSLVDKLNFRDTPYIKDDNIIRRLQKGERLTYGPNFLWEIELINDKGLLNSEVDIFYKEKAFSLPSGKSVQILEQFRRDDGYEFTEMVKCSANLGSGDVTFSTEKTNVDFISMERWVRLTDSYGNSGYVYERFVELDMYDYYEVYNTYMDQEAPYLNLRSEPTSKSINITRMSDGTKLILLSEGNVSNDKWIKVRVLESGKVGYAHTKWIRKINEE